MTNGNLTRRMLVNGVAVTAATLLPGQSVWAATKPQIHIVKIKRFKFEPKNLSVKVGDTIRWVNEDLAPHTATANELGWDTGELVKNQKAEITVTGGMETRYFCAFHPHMKGSIEIL
ncbi:MAG: cupredoxin family copper-binding protein [Lentilitoribacter sp.]